MVKTSLSVMSVVFIKQMLYYFNGSLCDESNVALSIHDKLCMKTEKLQNDFNNKTIKLINN